MRQNIVYRVIKEAEYIVDNNATLRQTAKIFSLGKSTIHKDMTIHLKRVNIHLYRDVRKILDKNKEERHIRGGESTKRKFINSQNKRQK